MSATVNITGASGEAELLVQHARHTEARARERWSRECRGHLLGGHPPEEMLAAESELDAARLALSRAEAALEVHGEMSLRERRARGARERLA